MSCRVTEVREAQFSNTPAVASEVTLAGMVMLTRPVLAYMRSVKAVIPRKSTTFARLVQFSKRRVPTDWKSVFLSAVVTLVSAEQFANAELPMIVTLSGMWTLSRATQPLKALSPMTLTVAGMITEVSFLESLKALAGISLMLFCAGISMCVS